MRVEHWRVKQLFQSALERASDERAAYLREACAGDEALRQEVESLLSGEKDVDGFLETSALEAAAKMFSEDPSPSLIGRQMGSYQVLSQLGAGAMGEVYKAYDTRLGRHVAIKVLPEAFANDPERLSRFQREAKMLAALNHPNIATIHGLEESDGVHYLVMELVSGQTLAEELKSGPLRIGEALKIAAQIAEALEAAHERGVIHRDLKPANVAVTPEARVKLLDFGLAKAFAGDSGQDLSHTPTVITVGTEEGRILGTPAYMSPEQARGKPVDKRADIWAFGVVLFEMLTGKSLHSGETAAEIVAAVMMKEPNLDTLPSKTPPAIRNVLRRCLEKNLRLRLQHIGEARIVIESTLSGADPAAEPGAVIRKGRERFAWVIAAIAIVVAALATAVPYFRRTPAEVRPVRFTISAPEKQSFPPGANFLNVLSVSPDGSRLAFLAVDPARRLSSGIEPWRLWIRDLDSHIAQPLPGTDAAYAPFWSPDSRFIAFTVGSVLKKVGVMGGPPQTLTAVTTGTEAMGTWNREGVILFSPRNGSAILRVPSAGGSAAPVTALDASRQQDFHAWPDFLPDGRHFLYFAHSTNPENSAIYVGSLDSTETKLLLNANSLGLYSPPGYLLFIRAGTLLAQPFDAARLELKGEAVPIAEGVQFNPGIGGAAVAVSQNGVLAYRVAPTPAQTKLVWVDRKGGEQPLPAPPHAYREPRLSPDGQRVAITVDELGSQEWFWDIGRGGLTRLTFEGNYNGAMAWTPDGKRVAFNSNREGPRNIFWQLADGSSGAERLTTSTGNDVASSWSADGKTLAFEELTPGTGWDLWVFRLGDHKAQPFLQTRFNEIDPRFSPDGRWLAYASDESGRYEVYVQPYPGPGGKWQISTDGGTEPVWARNGELFYRNGDKMMAVETTTGSNFSADKPKVLFEGHYATYQTLPSYDVTPDGQRFLLTKTGEQPPQEINVVLNWFEELKQKVPTGKK